MTTAQWLLGFHLVGAFLFVSGAIAVGVLHSLSLRREQPSEIALLLRLTRPAVALVGVGAWLALGFGIWLAHHDGLSFDAGWISASIALWIASVLLGAVGGRSARHTRYLAEQLAAEGDTPSERLTSSLRDPVARSLNYGSFLALVAVLALMVWKP